LQRRAPGFDVRLARCDDDILGAQRLRYAVFVEEMGAGGDMVDHARRLERDELDPFFDHLLLIDRTRDPATHEHVIGVYRLLPCDRARALGRFYCDSEYDLAPLRQSGRKLVELGRSCVHRDHRRGAAMLHLWNGLADYVLSRGIEIMFGVASFPGTDVTQHAMALSYLPRSISRRRRCACAPAAAFPADGPDPARGDRPGGGAGRDPAAHPRLSAAGRLRGRGGVHRPRLQHHRCLPDHGHIGHVGKAP
jgi:putative hemolysin